jgi:hypothetical protein
MAHDELATGRPIPHSANRQCVLCKSIFRWLFRVKHPSTAVPASSIPGAVDLSAADSKTLREVVSDVIG